VNTFVHSLLSEEGTCVKIGDHVSSLKDRKPRGYRLRARANKQAETHRLLAKAAFELHSSVGPAKTTISAIADKAGVQRLTVYRHFADQEAIFAACTAHSFERDPPPDPLAWVSIADPETRLRTALGAVYGYCRRNHQLLANLYRDAELPPVTAGLARRAALLAKCVEILEVGWNGSHRMTAAALGHALDFRTWESLTRTQGLSDDEAIEVMIRFVKVTAR
jgi:AcrR family transcriptional regulator